MKQCGWAQWLMPVIPALWETEDCLSSGVQDQLGEHGETLSLPKIENLSLAWWYVSVVLAPLEAEVAGLVEPRGQRLR